jgi:hypothetical protein
MTLYILKAIPSGLFKIGITDQFDRRLSAIRRQNSEQVLVVSTYRGETGYIKQLEREIHEELSGVCWQYEWFYGGAEIDAVIDRLDRQFFPEKYSENPNVVPSSIGV